jgi:hypothetical protein
MKKRHHDPTPENKKGFNKMLKPFSIVAGVTRLELATSCVTGKRSNQTELHPRNLHFLVGDAGLEPATSTL